MALAKLKLAETVLLAASALIVAMRSLVKFIVYIIKLKTKTAEGFA